MKMAQNQFTKLHASFAIASFSLGAVIACACLFIVPPPGEISNSAINVVSELLLLTGAILGVKTSFDLKLQKFKTEIREQFERQADNNSDNSRVETDINV